MPELPDVEVEKQYLNATALHKEIEHAEVRSQQMLEGIDAQELDKKLRNHSFTETRRHGKFLLVRLDQDGWLVLHFGMTGSLKYFKVEENAPEYAQILFQFANGYRLAYVMARKLGHVFLVDRPNQLIEQKELGPDVLADDFDFTRFRRILGEHRGMIKPRLMDQHVMAGIGNVYSDEILFQARVHPRTKLGDLDYDALRRIYDCMQEVLRVAIEHDADPGQFPDNYLTSHRGTEDKCPQCGGPIDRVQVASRTSYFCPECQRL